MGNFFYSATMRLLTFLCCLTVSVAQAAGPAAKPAGDKPVIQVNPDLPPIPIENPNIIHTLPSTYPEHWFIVQDIVFPYFRSGKALVVDATKDKVAEQYKGAFDMSMIGNYVQATKRPEIYVVESFYSRGTRGVRTDVVTIHDKQNLKVIDEIVLNGEKRFVGFPERYGLRLIDNEKYLLIYNFSPASSLTVVDIEKRKIVDEFDIAGCALVYPTGQRGVTSLCSNGGMLASVLDKDGKLAHQERIAPFFSSDDNPVFERPAMVDGTAYFFGFKGEVHEVDMRGRIAKVGKSWSLINEEEAAANWRPGGMVLTHQDDLGHFYILMHPDGHDGTHQSGGPEVWVFDAKKRKRTQKIQLQGWGLSVGLSRGKKPLLMVTTAPDMHLQVYDALSGKHLRTMTELGLLTPFETRGAR